MSSSIVVNNVPDLVSITQDLYRPTKSFASHEGYTPRIFPEYLWHRHYDFIDFLIAVPFIVASACAIFKAYSSIRDINKRLEE